MHNLILRGGCLLVALLLGWRALLAQEYDGYLDSSTDPAQYPITLTVGDTVLIIAEPTSGDLDTVITLRDPDGQVVAANDDRSRSTLGSAIGYTATVAGEYWLTVSRYELSDSSGSYDLTIEIGDTSLLQRFDTSRHLDLSGPIQYRDTDHFRIHHTLEGEDAVTEAYVDAVAISIEEIRRIQIDRMGWPPPPPDGTRGGDARYDIYLANLLGAGESALGYTAPDERVGDNPNTPQIERDAVTSYIVLENDFVDRWYFNTTNPTALMRTTLTHEFNHALQMGFQVDDMLWYYEATATWMETASLIKDEDATGYVETIFKYPEVCFGSEGSETDGFGVYGHWLFMQALVDRFGDDIILKLWENLATQRGFTALEVTLASYDMTIPAMVAHYHTQNLVRRYQLAPDFDATVWLENTIDADGRWTYSGRGIQELAANYFAVTLPPGTYDAGLVNDDAGLLLYAVAVRGDEADVIDLGRGGSFTTDGYDHVYLMVFNPLYDDNTRRCEYRDYSLDISAGKGAVAPVLHTWDATYFEPLR